MVREDRHRPRWFRADLVVSSLRRNRGPSHAHDGLLEAATKEVLMKRFEVYEMALQMVSALRPAVERIRLHDRDLALQLKRAGSSVPGNIAEGARRAGQDRLHHYRIAAGSAGEVRSHLAVAMAWGDVDQATVTPALSLLDSILAILWRLTHP
jgi:four helix bundle protein